MTLSTFQIKLDSLGFETVLSDNVLQGSRERGNLAVEVSIDSGGEVLLVKKTLSNQETRAFKFKKRSIPIVCESMDIETIRVHLDYPEDFDTIEKNFLRA